jgi:hypothetical protein
MSLTEITVTGTLNADGTLELDQKPHLSPGPVTVVLRQESGAQPPLPEDWWQFMQNARKKMEEAGCQFMDEKEMQAHIEWLREGDRIDDLLRDAVEGQKSE